jgi:hypothetical protein
MSVRASQRFHRGAPEPRRTETRLNPDEMAAAMLVAESPLDRREIRSRLDVQGTCLIPRSLSLLWLLFFPVNL